MTKRGRYLAAIAVILAAFATTSLAYWTASGGGSAQTHLPDPRDLSFGPATSSAELYPGGSSSVAFTASNPNPYRVHIPSLMLDTDDDPDGFAVDAGHPDCSDSALSFSTQTNAGHGWDVPPKVGNTDGSLAITLPSALAMSTDAEDGCQGAIFTVFVVAGP